MRWHEGPVSSRISKLGNPRTVILARYCKAVRVLSDAEVARSVKSFIDATGDHSDMVKIPEKTVTLSLAKELRAVGIEVLNAEDWSAYDKLLPNDEKFLKRVEKYKVSKGSTTFATNNSSVNNSDATNGASYSIDHIVGENGDYGMGVVLDSDLFDGLDRISRFEKVKEFVRKLAGSSIPVQNEKLEADYIHFADSRTRVHSPGASQSHKAINELYAAQKNTGRKAVAGSLSLVQISEVLEVAGDKSFEPSKYPHANLDANGWEYYNSYVQLPTGEIYRAKLNIAVGENGIKTLYRIELKKIDQGNARFQNGTASSVVNFGERIAQPGDSVNANYSLDTFTGNVYDGVSGAAIRNTALADAIRSEDVEQSAAPDVFHVNVGDRGFAVSLMDNGDAAVVGYDLNSPAADYIKELKNENSTEEVGARALTRCRAAFPNYSCHHGSFFV